MPHTGYSEEKPSLFNTRINKLRKHEGEEECIQDFGVKARSKETTRKT
jgi:hypothetical protein